MDKCYHRFDKNFQRFPNQNFGDFGRFNGDNQLHSKAYMPAFGDSNGAYMSEAGSILGSPYGHSSKPSSDNFVAAQSSFSDPSWFVDSGATNHITSNLSNLSLHTPYNGGDRVTVGNGKKLPITHIGTSRLCTHLKPLTFLSIPDVLHVSSIKKNLISVSQLT